MKLLYSKIFKNKKRYLRTRKGNNETKKGYDEYKVLFLCKTFL